jgi:hypothetical protein
VAFKNSLVLISEKTLISFNIYVFVVIRISAHKVKMMGAFLAGDSFGAPTMLVFLLP